VQAVLNVRKGGVLLKQWVHRRCVLSDTRLLIYKGEENTVFLRDLMQARKKTRRRRIDSSRKRARVFEKETNALE
jgi:hypothetical protein